MDKKMTDFPPGLLILNGKSAGNPELREAINQLRDQGVEIHVASDLGKR